MHDLFIFNGMHEPFGVHLQRTYHYPKLTLNESIPCAYPRWGMLLSKGLSRRTVVEDKACGPPFEGRLARAEGCSGVTFPLALAAVLSKGLSRTPVVEDKACGPPFEGRLARAEGCTRLGEAQFPSGKPYV